METRIGSGLPRMTALPETAGTPGCVKRGGESIAPLRVTTARPGCIGSEEVAPEVAQDIERNDPLGLLFREAYRHPAPPLEKAREMWR